MEGTLRRAALLPLAARPAASDPMASTRLARRALLPVALALVCGVQVVAGCAEPREQATAGESAAPRAAFEPVEAYWLGRRTSEYENLLVTRGPLEAALASPPPAGTPLHEARALLLATHARNALWYFPPREQEATSTFGGGALKLVERDARLEDGRLVLPTGTFELEPADLEQVLELLRDPEGPGPLHRPLGAGPYAGDEALAALERDIARTLAR